LLILLTVWVLFTKAKCAGSTRNSSKRFSLSAAIQNDSMRLPLDKVRQNCCFLLLNKVIILSFTLSKC